MKIRDSFAKEISRPIEGVIKADDTAHLATEVDEYVLTNEAQQQLESLLEAYTNYTNANGVWISGFFGSGKSHMLKMLAHLLGDVQGQDFPRADVSESFRAKADGEFLPGLLTKAATIPAKSLLFNIDVKATLISKDQSDALLKVFVKVFDESRGYYGKVGSVAKFESDLDSRGQYEDFKAAYREIAGKDWLVGREEHVLEEINVAKAYAKISGEVGDTPTNILTKYRNEYAVSIEDFADDVASWLSRQDDKTFRLNFFVDEVGQFIGSDTKLMLNLQSIAESLNTKCKGRSWVLVTSQEDMDKVIGDRTKQQGNDFSKIQARFATRIKLTSADVEEVIRKRLLEKNDAAARELESIYAAESANFKTLFDFVDGAKTYRNFTDEDHFVGTYPFVTYQFPLFQAAMVGLSDHNVFEGRNSSVGERSMLGVVQEVLKDTGNADVGTLATFDELFSGIRAALKSAEQRSILVAEEHLDNELALRLLKALFLVKYVDDFHATPRNLTVLMYDQFGRDLPQLAQNVQDALAVLEQQTYIQRTGNSYEYLSSEEKLIEEEIKNVDLDGAEVSQRLVKLINDDVIKTNKFRYAKNGQDFPFGVKLDDQAYGPQKELTVHYISPAYDQELDTITKQGAGRDELRVVLDPDDRLVSDLRLLLKTEKYIKRKRNSSLTTSVEQILNVRAGQNDERRKELIGRARNAIGKALLIVQLTDVESKSTDAVTRVSDGFQDLIRRTYPNLKLLGDITYTESDIAKYVNPPQEGLHGTEYTGGDAASDDVFNFVSRQQTLGARVTVKTIVENYESKPYGWSRPATLVSIARLYGMSKLSLTTDSNNVVRSEAAALLRNSVKYPHITVSVQKQYDDKQIKALTEFTKAFLVEANPPREPMELAHETSTLLAGMKRELDGLRATTTYPFAPELDAPIALLGQVVGHPDEWYLTDFKTHIDGLLEAKENTIDPIRGFLAGPQKAIYDEARAFLDANKTNIEVVGKDIAEPVNTLLSDSNVFRGNAVQRLKKENANLQAAIKDALEQERASAVQHVTGKVDTLASDVHFGQAAPDLQAKVTSATTDFETKVGAQDQILAIRGETTAFTEYSYPQLVDLIYGPESPNEDAHDEAPQTVPLSAIAVLGGPAILANEADIDAYLAAYRAALLDTISTGKRVTR